MATIWEHYTDYGMDDIRINGRHARLAQMLKDQGIEVKERGRSCVLSRNVYVIGTEHTAALKEASRAYVQALKDAWMKNVERDPNYPHLIRKVCEVHTTRECRVAEEIQPDWMCCIYYPVFFGNYRLYAYVDMREITPRNGHVDIDVPDSWPRGYYLSDHRGNHVKCAEFEMSQYYGTPIHIHYHARVIPEGEVSLRDPNGHKC